MDFIPTKNRYVLAVFVASSFAKATAGQAIILLLGKVADVAEVAILALPAGSWVKF